MSYARIVLRAAREAWRSHGFLMFFLLSAIPWLQSPVLAAIENPNVGNLLVHVVDPFSGKMILPTTNPLPGERSNVIEVSGTRGEYLSASFVMRPVTHDVDNVAMTVTPLRGTAGTIPADRIDIKIVKAWYQAGGAWKLPSTPRGENRPVLVPELLLNDDRLIKVDYLEQKNYLRVANAAGAKYVWISNPEPFEKTHHLVEHRASPDFDDYPVKDAQTLRPFALEKDFNKQIWVNIHIPDHAISGVYSGKIVLRDNKTVLGEIDVALRVLPFDLAEPKLTYSVYYRGLLCPGAKSVSSEYKTPTQMRLELIDMWNHGVKNPTVYQNPRQRPPSLFEDVLKLRKQVGMGNQPLYFYGVRTDWYPRTPGYLQMLSRDVKNTVNVARSFGVPEVYIYGKDEAKGDQLLAERQAWSIIHEAGAKVFVAGSAGQFEAVGDLLDLSIMYGAGSRNEARKFHSIGHKIFMYANPQTAVENPALYRLNYGIQLWAAGYDGAMPYAYQDCGGSCWNDFDGAPWRDHMFTYPAVDGVIGTMAWEGYRQAINDVRYLETLEDYASRGLMSGDAGKRNASKSAVSFLDSLRRAALESVENGDTTGSSIDLDMIRNETINHILELSTTR